MNQDKQHHRGSLARKETSKICKGDFGMENFLSERGFVCKPILWIGDGAALIPHDEQHAFRYEVSDQRGNVVGFINTDRARQHPHVKWERSLLRNGRVEELDGKYGTVREALAAF